MIQPDVLVYCGQITKAYLDFLYSDAGQEIAAQHNIRPRSEAMLKKYAGTFKPIKAVWDIMKAQNYGRIVVTTSSSVRNTPAPTKGPKKVPMPPSRHIITAWPDCR